MRLKLAGVLHGNCYDAFFIRWQLTIQMTDTVPDIRSCGRLRMTKNSCASSSI